MQYASTADSVERWCEDHGLARPEATYMLLELRRRNPAPDRPVVSSTAYEDC
eukprot:SAG11_NODE_2447_length_3350_cov_1.723162_3_plen_52_part_00